jgi:ankyrin repeat protein
VNCKEDKTKNTPFHIAAGKGRSDILSLLLSSAKFIESKNLDGNTPLNISLETGSYECSKLIIQAGSVDLNNPDSEGNCLCFKS